MPSSAVTPQVVDYVDLNLIHSQGLFVILTSYRRLRLLVETSSEDDGEVILIHCLELGREKLQERYIKFLWVFIVKVWGYLDLVGVAGVER